MFDNFYVYLLYIALIILIFFSLVLSVFYKIKKKTGKKEIREEIKGGNVSVFFDRDKNVIIIPYAKDKFGSGRAVDIPSVLKWPYNASRLGEAIKESMRKCEAGKPCSHGQLMGILNYSDWKGFTEGRKNISVHFHEGTGIVINTTTRRIDGSYQFNHFGFETVVRQDASDGYFGEVILEMLNKCKR